MMNDMKLLLVGLVTSALMLAATPPPPGTWKLESESVLEGNAPSYRQGLIMNIAPSGSEGSVRAKMDGPIPAGVVAHDRMRQTISPDGLTLTQTAVGKDKDGKPYRYELIWKKK